MVPPSALPPGIAVAGSSMGDDVRPGTQKYMAKRTRRHHPGTIRKASDSPLPPLADMLSHKPTVIGEAAAAGEPAFQRPTPIPISQTSHADPYYTSTQPELRFQSQSPRNPTQNGDFWFSSTSRSHSQGLPQLERRTSAISSDARQEFNSRPMGAGNSAHDNLYACAPVMKKPRLENGASVEGSPGKASRSPSTTVPRSQPPPRNFTWNGHTGDGGPVCIDLTQDAPGPESSPDKGAKGGNEAKSKQTEPGNPITSRGGDTGATTIGLPTNHQIHQQSPSPARASSVLQPPPHTYATFVPQSPHTPDKRQKLLNGSSKTVNGAQQPQTKPRSPASAKISADLTQNHQTGKKHSRSSTYLSTDGGTTTSLNAVFQKTVKSAQFDSSAFDTAIYKQLGAAHAPAGVTVAPHLPNYTPRESQRRYIHANPAIHGMHNRPDVWYARKAQEIQDRGGRKFWFGKVAARLRWLKSKRSESAKAKPVDENTLPERSDPEPRTYNRPLDFGDVPESQLPEDVQQNEDWLKACAWFRQQQNMREIRLRESKRCEQEANEYYKIISQGGLPNLGSDVGK